MRYVTTVSKPLLHIVSFPYAYVISLISYIIYRNDGNTEMAGPGTPCLQTITTYSVRQLKCLIKATEGTGADTETEYRTADRLAGHCSGTRTDQISTAVRRLGRILKVTDPVRTLDASKVRTDL